MQNRVHYRHGDTASKSITETSSMVREIRSEFELLVPYSCKRIIGGLEMRFGKESIDEEIELDGNRGDEKVE